MTRHDFAVALLRALRAPVTMRNVAALLAWQAAENTLAAFNPLATTHGGPPGSPFANTLHNRAGVRHFADFHDGVEATRWTLEHDVDLYADVVAALRAGDTPAPTTLRAVAASPWGTRIADPGALVDGVLDAWGTHAETPLSTSPWRFDA